MIFSARCSSKPDTSVPDSLSPPYQGRSETHTGKIIARQTVVARSACRKRRRCAACAAYTHAAEAISFLLERLDWPIWFYARSVPRATRCYHTLCRRACVWVAPLDEMGALPPDNRALRLWVNRMAIGAPVYALLPRSGSSKRSSCSLSQRGALASSAAQVW